MQVRVLSRKDLGLLRVADRRLPVVFGRAEMSQQVHSLNGAPLTVNLDLVAGSGDSPAAVVFKIVKAPKPRPRLRLGAEAPAGPPAKRKDCFAFMARLSDPCVRDWLAEVLLAGMLVVAAAPSPGAGTRTEGAAAGDLLVGSRAVPLEMDGPPVDGIRRFLRCTAVGSHDLAATGQNEI